MLKLMGVIMICLSSTALGFRQGDYHKDHYNELIYLKKIVVLIRGEIRYNCGILSEVFGNVSLKVKDPYDSIFKELSEELSSGNGKMFNEIWKNIVINRLKETKLWENDILSFMELGENMGYLDLEMQLNYIDFYVDKLNSEIQETYEKLQGNVKLFKALGIMGGLLLTILIL